MAEADPRTTFNVHDAKTHLSRLIERVQAGEEIVLAKAGKPCAKIVAYAEPGALPPRTPGRWRHLLGSVSEEDVMSPCFSGEDIERFESDDIDPDRRG